MAHLTTPSDLVQKLAHLDCRTIPAPSQEMPHPAKNLVENWVKHLVSNYSPKAIDPDQRPLTSAFVAQGSKRLHQRLDRTFSPGIYGPIATQVRLRLTRQGSVHPDTNRIDVEIIRSVLNDVITALLVTTKDRKS